MKERKSSVKQKANELKIKAWKLLIHKAFNGTGETEALKAIIQIAEETEKELLE